MFESLQIGKAVKLISRTTPILFARLTAYLIFWLVSIVYFALVIGLSYLLYSLWPPLAYLGVIIGVIGAGGIYRLAVRYTFYLLKAAHIAVIAELLNEGRLPKGKGQLQWGKDQVTARFGDVSGMFVIDELVNGIVLMFSRTVTRLVRWLPGDAMDGLAKVLRRLIRYAVNYVDEAILARSFWRNDQSIWESAEDGVVLYCQVWKPILKNAFVLMILSFAPLLLIALLIIVPMGLAIAAVNPALGGWAMLIMLFLGYLGKVAIGDTIVMAAIIATYKNETDKLAPDPIMVAKLESLSGRFRELKQKAQDSMSGQEPHSAEKPVNNDQVDPNPLLKTVEI